MSSIFFIVWLNVSMLVSGAHCDSLRKRSSSPALLQIVARTTMPLPLTMDSFGSGCAALEPANNGTHYTVPVRVGTPPQSFSVVADTGSNALLIPSCICQKTGYCSKHDRCFQGMNKSSTFFMEASDRGQELLITFGSGQVGAVKAVDVAEVGGLRTNMSDGLLLMVQNALDIQGKFEGILGLGVPARKPVQVLAETDRNVVDMPVDLTDSAASLAKSGQEDTGKQKGEGDWLKWLKNLIPGLGDDSAAAHPAAHPSAHPAAHAAASAPKGFLEQSNVSRFSMCFHNDGTGGLFRMGSNLPFENVLTNLGQEHWGLDFRGISVGSGETAQATTICTKKQTGMKTACGAIPDSGTSAIMGPKKQILNLMGALCDNWARCKTNHTKFVEAANASSKAAADIYGYDPWGYKPLDKASTFMLLLQDCHSWLDNGSLDEVPPIQFHLGGHDPDSKSQTVEIPSSAYLVEQETEEVENVKTDLFGLGEISLPKKTGVMKKVCVASIGAMEYPTKLNGDVWILGVPLFSQYKVTYDLAAKPSGGMSFTQIGHEGCGSCNAAGFTKSPTSTKEALLARGSGLVTASRPKLRSLSGPFRRPTIDVTRPL